MMGLKALRMMNVGKAAGLVGVVTAMIIMGENLAMVLFTVV